jgi:hypothetical protein
MVYHLLGEEGSISSPRWLSTAERIVAQVKSTQVNTRPKAKSQAKDKRAKDRQ